VTASYNDVTRNGSYNRSTVGSTSPSYNHAATQEKKDATTTTTTRSTTTMIGTEPTSKSTPSVRQAAVYDTEAMLKLLLEPLPEHMYMDSYTAWCNSNAQESSEFVNDTYAVVLIVYHCVLRHACKAIYTYVRNTHHHCVMRSASCASH
jgi:hypothetical protein